MAPQPRNVGKNLNNLLLDYQLRACIYGCWQLCHHFYLCYVVIDLVIVVVVGSWSLLLLLLLCCFVVMVFVIVVIVLIIPVMLLLLSWSLLLLLCCYCFNCCECYCWSCNWYLWLLLLLLCCCFSCYCCYCYCCDCDCCFVIDTVVDVGRLSRFLFLGQGQAAALQAAGAKLNLNISKRAFGWRSAIRDIPGVSMSWALLATMNFIATCFKLAASWR